MFTSNDKTSYDEILDLVRGRVTPDMNHSLCVAYSNVETKEVVFQMGPRTAPSPNGMSFLFFFFQKFWDIVNVDVVTAVKSFLTSDRILKQLNYTLVSLIPKVAEPQDMT